MERRGAKMNEGESTPYCIAFRDGGATARPSASRCGSSEGARGRPVRARDSAGGVLAAVATEGPVDELGGAGAVARHVRERGV